MVTQEFLKSILHYNQQTGAFTWIREFNDSGKRFAMNGKRAGNIHTTKDGNTYERITFNGKNWHSHRLAWFYTYGEWPEQIDHIDGDGLNNAIANLRNVDNKTNGMNQKLNAKNKTGRIGVSFCGIRKKYVAGIKVNQKRIGLGRFETFEEACKARHDAEVLYGFHENHGTR